MPGLLIATQVEANANYVSNLSSSQACFKLKFLSSMAFPPTSTFFALFLITMLLCFHSATPLPTNNDTDLEALLALRSQITSDHSHVLTNTWNTNTSFCNWPGVSCSSRRQRVTSLDLRELGLSGTIDLHIGNLSFLAFLDLSNNSLHGYIPETIGRLSRLKYLNLSVNELSGPIPPAIFNLSSLKSLVLGMNKLSGDLPDRGGFYLPQLQFLSLSYNQIGGRVPASLSQCLSLQTLSISYNAFVGEIPPELGGLPNLQTLYLGVNNLTGTIPTSLANLTGLGILSLSKNHLEGIIPEEFGQLQKLVFLNLAENNLSGTVPDSIFNISSLQQLSLSFNHLLGHVPADVGYRLPNLEGLYISENKFTGRIPASLSNASMISILEFTDNFLSGPVPASLGDLQYLQSLVLQTNQLDGGLEFITSLTRCRYLENLLIGENMFAGKLPESVGNLSTNLLRFRAPSCQLTGEIPASLGNLTGLIYLNLHDNQLSGVISPSIAGLKNLQLIYLYINRLEGPVPHDLCKLTSLSILFLYENNFSGSIPECLANLTSLQRLSLAGNSLTSTIPESIWTFRGLYFLNLSLNSLEGPLSSDVSKLKLTLGQLDLAYNYLVGSIPSSVGSMQMLKYLILSHNNFSGPIPQSFGQIVNIEGMDLSSNSLTGTIPSSLANLSYFSFVNFSFNQLEGEIPKGGVFTNLSAESFMGNLALCGETKLGVPPCKPKVTNTTKSKSKVLVYILPAIAAVIVIAALLCFLLLRNQKEKKLQLPVTRGKPNNNPMISYHELIRATDGFSEANLLGVGSHGSVYKGVLDDGTLAAIKVLNLNSEGALKSFDSECQVLRMVRHRNVVKVISTCSNMDIKALVLQFMPNGSLEKWLYSEGLRLTLRERTSIMLDVALALEHLHHEHTEVVVHCDLKPSNVLLDDDMVAHVGDFGIAKLLASDGQSIMQSVAPGTIGYLAPEYGSEGRVSPKGDVYSFGILLLETFTRKKPTDAMFAGTSSLTQWVSDAFPDSVLDVVDVRLLGGEKSMRNQQDWNMPEQDPTFRRRCLTSVIELGLSCCKESQKERISIKDAAVKLKKILSEMNAKSGSTELASCSS